MGPAITNDTFTGAGLILGLLSPQSLGFPPLTFDFGLVRVDLTLLVRLLYFLALELIADQSAGAQAQSAADCRSNPGGAHSCTDDTADRGSAQSTDTGALLAGGQTAARAAHKRTEDHDDR
jgi:hypothetical protein